MTVHVLNPENPLGHYILDPKIGEGKVPIPCPDTLIWAKWFGEFTHMRIVAKTEVGLLLVSTVFLALDHSFGNGPPMLFETMVFENHSDRRCCDEYGGYCLRGPTWEDAYWTHKETVAKVEADTGCVATPALSADSVVAS